MRSPYTRRSIQSLLNKLKKQLFIDDDDEECKVGYSRPVRSNELSDFVTNSPLCIKPIVQCVISHAEESEAYGRKSPCFFKVNEDTDNLVYNQDHFTFYTKYTTNEIVNNDEETKFLCSIASKTGDEVDISEYLIMKSNVIINCSYQYA